MHLTYDIRSHIDPHKIDQFNAEILDVVKRALDYQLKVVVRGQVGFGVLKIEITQQFLN